MFEIISERIRRMKSLFGTSNGEFNPVVIEVEPIRLEQEQIEVMEIDESGAALSTLHGYSADEKINSIKLGIEKYRELSKHSEIEEAVQEITDEAIIKDVDGKIIQLDLKNIDEEILDDDMKDKIHVQFDRILSLLKFNQKAEQYFRQWYIDGRAYFQVFANPEKQNGGLIGVRLLNPKYLTKVLIKDKETKKNTYFYYYKPEPDKNNIGFSSDMERSEPALIPADNIIFIPSGFIDYGTDMYISYLHKAIKPYNNLRDIEDSAVIYRLTRAPERRVFYVDVSKLPPSKAEAYMQNLMRKFQNKMVYNSASGAMDQRKNTVSMIEDFYLPVTPGGGTKIETLQGGTQLGEISDIQYFYNKLLKSLKVPMSRFDAANKSYIDFSRGAGDIDREELRFSKFINKLREQFSILFYELLKRQVIAKNIIDENDWKKIDQFILFDWSRDMHYEAVKYREELKQKLEILGTADGFIGKYITRAWIFRSVFDMNDEEIRDMENDLALEAETGEAAVPEEEPTEDGEQPPPEPLGGEDGEQPPPEPLGGEGNTPEPAPVEASMSKSKKKKHQKKTEIVLFGSLMNTNR